MLNNKDLIAKMKTHFPRWMDIRKRTEKSDGGKLLISIAEETAEIENAIEEYKKDFFISSYLNKSNDILDFLYKAHIGEVNVNELLLTKPNLVITEDVKDFYDSQDKSYYNEGVLYFKPENIETIFDLELNAAKIEYRINDYRLTQFAEKMHVWNVYDEFATFLGLMRYENENNQELLNRILVSPKRPTNSSANGIKNAILNALENIDPDLNTEDILIERPTPENLLKYYKEFNSVIEKLAQVNRDVFRTKKWDIDSWSYDFKSVDYIPHVWDAVIDTYQNGIGFKEDLSIELTNTQDTTDAVVSIYEQSISTINEYVRKKDIKTQVKLDLMKYDNILKPINVKYKITAAEAKKITSESIALECSTKHNGEEERFVEELIMNTENSLKDIQVLSKSQLEDEKLYKLAFIPKGIYGHADIDKLQLLLEDENGDVTTQDLMINKNGFFKDSTGRLRFNGVKLYANNTSQFSSSFNVMNSSDGISLSEITKEGKLLLDLNGFMNERIKINHSCNLSPIANSEIAYTGFYLSAEGSYISVPEYDDNSIEFRITANQVSFDIREGNYMISEVVDGIETNSHIGAGIKQYSTQKYDAPKEIFLRISAIGNQKMIVNNFRYSHYQIGLNLSKGSFLYLGEDMIIPDTRDQGQITDSNQLSISIKSFTSYSPILHFIHIGSTLQYARYETDIIPFTAEVKRKIEVRSNCEIRLIEVNEDGETIAEQKNYEPYSSYKALTKDAYIRLDMSAYSSIKEMKTIAGRFETTGTGKNTVYFLKLKMIKGTDGTEEGEEVHKIVIEGERLIPEKLFYLHELLDVQPNEEIYASKLLEGFIITNGTNQRLAKITPNKLTNIKADNFTFINVPEDMNCAFVTNITQNVLSISNSFMGQFQVAYMFPKNSNKYIAFNEFKMVRPEERNIEIVDVFNPFLPINNAGLVYLVESLDPSKQNKIAFDKQDTDFIMLNNWALGNKPLRIKTEVNMTNGLSYDIDNKNLQREFALSNTIRLNRQYALSSGELIDLSNFIIKVPNGMTLVYKTRPSLANINQAPDFFSVETIIPEDDGFNKLKHSNLDEIIYIGTTPWNGSLIQPSDIPSSDFKLLKEEGIIVWNNDSYSKANQTIYIVNTIKIPDYIQISLDEMYKKIQYNLDAYKKADEILLVNMAADSRYNLDGYDIFNNDNIRNNIRLRIFCSKPGFEAQVKSEDVIENEIRTKKWYLEFKATNTNSVVAVKTGYYYIDGDEHYLFANQMIDNIDKFNNIEFYNVNREEGEILFSKRSKNYLMNSVMELNNTAEIFNMDFNQENKISGISKLNSITACDSFNHWTSFGNNLSLVKGYNGLGIKFEPQIDNGYAYIDITQYLLENTFISLYKSGDIKMYIGREKKFFGLEFGNSTVIELDKELTPNLVEENMLEITFSPVKDYRYYLIAKNSGTIDDIILHEASKSGVVTGIHKKNIDHLKFGIEEKIQDDYISRLYLDDNRGNKLEGAEINNGTIINSSLINWGVTDIKRFDEHNSWSKCKLNKVNIQNGTISTLYRQPGTIETEPIFIGDTRTIKNFIFKINDVAFENMKGFSTKILISDSYNGSYRMASNHSDNVGFIQGHQLMPYVKLLINMPGERIIDNLSLFIEYKSSEEAAPAEVLISNGSVLSRILDTQYQMNYKLSNINIESVSDIKHISIQIRAAKENASNTIWTSWKEVQIGEDLKLVNTIDFKDYRFFQVRVALKNKNAFIKIKHIDLEVIR